MGGRGVDGASREQEDAERESRAKALLDRIVALREQLDSSPGAFADQRLQRQVCALTRLLGQASAMRRLAEVDAEFAQAQAARMVFESCERRFAPLAVVRQHAVGHGGFHTGALGIAGPRLRWVYDCGAWRADGKVALTREIARFAERIAEAARLDFLFLSHFDADHVSGVDELLARVTADTVVLPYLAPEDAFAVLAEARLDDELTHDLQEAVLDPTAWFGARGVRRVIRLQPGAGGERGSPAGLPAFAGPPGGEPEPLVLGADGRPLASGAAAAGCAEEVVAEPGLTCRALVADEELADWVFDPFVHPISDRARAHLRRLAEQTVGVSPSDAGFPDALRRFVTGVDDLKALRKAYRHEEAPDANGISLSLYVGPEGHVLRRRFGSGGQEWVNGWLLTGDAKLRWDAPRTAWLRHYRGRAEAVRWLMLPHHGAARNFHADLLDLAPLALFVTAEQDDSKRPHEEVLQILRRARGADDVWVVSSTKGDDLVETSGGSSYENDPDLRRDARDGWT